jgi:hypothetical protein
MSRSAVSHLDIKCICSNKNCVLPVFSKFAIELSVNVSKVLVVGVDHQAGLEGGQVEGGRPELEALGVHVALEGVVVVHVLVAALAHARFDFADASAIALVAVLEVHALRVQLLLFVVQQAAVHKEVVVGDGHAVPHAARAADRRLCGRSSHQRQQQTQHHADLLHFNAKTYF